MGEEADWIVENLLYGSRLGDDQEDEYEERCKFCGSDLVFWRETETGWRLYELYGQEVKPHRCHRGLTPAKIISNFDDLT